MKILKKSYAIYIIYATFFLSIIAVTIFGDSGLLELHTLAGAKKDISGQIEEMKARIEKMEQEKVLLTKPGYLESVVRRELGYIKDGETVFQITEER